MLFFCKGGLVFSDFSWDGGEPLPWAHKNLSLKENHIGSAVIEILRYRQKKFLLYILGLKIKGRGLI